MMDVNGVHLSSVRDQYFRVEKEAHKVAEELESSRKKRRQLEAEVRYLREKLKSFRKSIEQNGPEIPLYARQQAPQPRKEPQFFEVKVQYADSLGAGRRDAAVFEYPSEFRDYRHNYAPHTYSRQESLSCPITRTGRV